jgi:hypothetical protein
MDTDLVWTYKKTKWKIFMCGSVLLPFQEEEPKIEISLKLPSHVLLGLRCKQYTSDLHIKLLHAFLVSSHPCHKTHPIVAF